MPASPTTLTAASAGALDEQPPVGVLQRLELVVAADHSRRHAFDAARGAARERRGFSPRTR